MSAAHILRELVVVLGTAAVVTVVFQALKLPVVLGYVLAGLVIGPHVPIPLVANPTLIHVLSELGVILLMFTIGLELPLREIKRVGLPAAMTALFEVALVVAAGTLVARLLGFGATPALFAGVCLGISSTMLVAKAFGELGWKGGFTDLVFAVLVFEDLIAIVLLAVVTAVATGAGLDAAAVGALLAKLAGFLALVLVGGLLIVPRAIRWIATRARPETLLVAALAVCFGAAVLAEEAGFSVALGAFIAGVLIAESGRGHDVVARVEPFRDVFAMVFFVSVGLSIEPGVVGAQWPAILALSAVVLVVKPVGVAAAVFAAGGGLRPAMRAGLSLAQIGEFSFVIAGVVGDPVLLAIAVGVSCVTTLTSPLLVRRSEGIAAWAAGRLPKRLATFVSFYESWLARLRARDPGARTRQRSTFAVIALDAAAVTAIAIAAATIGGTALRELGVAGPLATALQIAGAAAAAAPFLVSLARRIARVARTIAAEVLPLSTAGLDTGRAPRRALVITLELAIALVVIAPIAAVIQPVVPGSFALVLGVAIVLAIAARRSIADFEGHVRAGSELIAEMIATSPSSGSDLAALLPGFDGTQTFAIEPTARAVGRSLAELDLRARTGTTVLAIVRADRALATPSPTEPLAAGDLLALAGSDEALAAAKALLKD